MIDKFSRTVGMNKHGDPCWSVGAGRPYGMTIPFPFPHLTLGQVCQMHFLEKENIETRGMQALENLSSFRLFGHATDIDSRRRDCHK